MGNTSCYYSSSGNGFSSCSSSSIGDISLSAGAIVGIVIGCLVAVLLIVIVIILIFRFLLRRQPITTSYPQHNPMNYQQQWPHNQQTNPSKSPPSYTEATTKYP